MSQDLTGYWTADDGGSYYLQMSGQVVWWLGLDNDGSLQMGTSFTNIFRGIVPPGSFPDRLEGEWADVPRGQTMNFGILNLSIEYESDGSPITLRRIVETGGFSGSVWTFQSRDVDRSFPAIGDLFGRIIKNTWHVDDPWDVFDPDRETLADNLDPLKDSVVVYGSLAYGEAVEFPQFPFVNSFPTDQPKNWDAFVNLNDPYDTAIFDTDASDADMTCHIGIDDSSLPDDLFSGISEDDAQRIRDKLNLPPVPIIHPEMVMFAHKDDDASIAQLPGWAEFNGNSVLLNGNPIDGNILRSENSTDDMSVSWLPIANQPQPGNRVRVTGVVSIDKGHDDSYLEIHPVYGIDVIDPTPRDDLSGVWGDSNRFTYYLHVVLNKFWMLITTPYRDLSFVAVFQGVLERDGVTLIGGWSTVPLGEAVGSGFMSFTLDRAKRQLVGSAGSPLAGRVIQKLYHANGHPCPLIGPVLIDLPAARCEVKEVEGATLIYSAKNPSLASHPEALYHWSVTGGEIIGSGSSGTVQVRLPAAHTSFTLAVDITLSGVCLYHAERDIVVKTRAQAAHMQLWCEIVDTITQINSGLQALADGPEPGSPPDPETLAKLEKKLDRALIDVRKLRHH